MPVEKSHEALTLRAYVERIEISCGAELVATHERCWERQQDRLNPHHYLTLLAQHDKCRIEGNDILASFHTHPNTGPDFLQEPSATDKRAVRDDPNLKGDMYIGEFVIVDDMIYLIQPDGEVREMGSRRKLLEEA